MLHQTVQQNGPNLDLQIKPITYGEEPYRAYSNTIQQRCWRFGYGFPEYFQQLGTVIPPLLYPDAVKTKDMNSVKLVLK